MSLADYLAKNYLTADSKPEKKSKKRKRKAGESGLVIADDDHTGWERSAADRDDDDAPVMVGQTTAEFRKAKKNNWQTIIGSAATLPTRTAQDDAAADAIIASADAEKRAHAAEDEDQPVMVEDDEGAEVLRMESGAHAGLQTGKDLARQMARKAARERRELDEGGSEAAAAMGKNAETIYRDASGRIVNVAMKRAEARAKAEAEEAKKAQQAEEDKGDVQRAEREARRAALNDAKYMTVARYADDAELNAELKERDRWNDPAAQFIEKKKKGRSITGRPLYQGAAPPNRYGIRPGHKWDGVDRGSGFEADWFKARNRKKNLEALDYAWQMDE